MGVLKVPSRLLIMVVKDYNVMVPVLGTLVCQAFIKLSLDSGSEGDEFS